MHDQNLASPEVTWLGVKLATLIAGFAGSVVSLSFVRELTPRYAILSVFTGIATTIYCTPPVGLYLALGPEMLSFFAFVIGLTAMNLIPAALKLSEIVRNDPLAFIDRLRGKGGEKNES